MTSRYTNQKRSSQAKAREGFSLIEILVVLVVLLVGILSIIQLFPGGFLTIQRTGEQGNASTLASQQIDQVKERLAIPEAVAALDTVTPFNPDGTPNINNDILPDDLTDSSSPYTSNLNHFRYIKGESFRVPLFSPNLDSGAQGSTYMVAQGPVFNKFDGNEYMVVHGAPLERTVQSSTNGSYDPSSGPILVDGQYAIDYDKMMIAFYPRLAAGRANPGRSFVFSFDYYASTATGVTVMSTTLQPPAALTGPFYVPDVNPLPDGSLPPPVWSPIFGNSPPANFVGFVQGTDTASRKFVNVSPNAAVGTGMVGWSDDPYEYAFYSDQIGGMSANPGVLIFNPSGHNTTIQTSTGTQPLIASVDYATYDNHVLREDRNVPSSGPYEFRLSVPFLLTSGDIQNDQTQYDGMFGNGSPDLLIYNANTGTELVRVKNGLSVGVVGAIVTPKTGSIRLNQNDVESKKLNNLTLRIFYRANRDWGMQLQKAATHYDLALNANSVSYHTFALSAQAGFAGRIYFAKCDTGKTVVLGRFTINENNTANTYTNEAYLIHSADAVDPTGKPYIDVTEQHPNMTSFNADVTGRAVENVQGGSLKSRVIWNNGSTSYVDGNGMTHQQTRWRKVDQDTFLLQGLSQ